MALAMEVSSCIRLPELAQSVTRRASEVLGGTAAALALARGQSLETVYLHRCTVPQGKGALRRLNFALTDLAHVNRAAIRYGVASDFVGSTLAGSLGWKDLTAVRLEGAD